jgi:hypothetical protein
MTSSRQYIQDRMMQSAARFWGLPETDTDASFDPIVALLMGACATELEKINGEIENSRSRVLERLVQLLSPEALTGVLPAHAIAYALPTEQVGQTVTEDQFYVSKRFAPQQEQEKGDWKDIYFSPAGNFLLHKAIVKYKAAGSKIIPADFTNTHNQQIIAAHNKTLPENELWLGIEAKTLNIEGCRFYFDVVHQSQKKQFFNQLPKANWYADGQKINHQAGYAVKKNAVNYFDIEAVLNRDVSVTEKWENHIYEFYSHHFVTLHDTDNTIAGKYNKKQLPQNISNVFEEKELSKIEAGALYWICIEFPENISSTMLEEVVVRTNCFPVVNRHLHNINYRLKEFVNIIPLLSEETFLDIYNIADQQGKLLHLMNDSDTAENDFSILLRHGGVGRFDNREAAETVDKLLHLLREETAAFSILGNDFLQNEMTALQQTINKLDQQITNKQLLKGNTPYLVINNKLAGIRQTIYVKFWSSNGAAANLIKAATPLNVYSSSQFESGTAKLITTTQGGRDRLSDSEKVLAYKSALLNKQKLVTNEDIAAFCRLRLAFTGADVQIKKGCDVMPGQQHGLIRTLDVHIELHPKDINSLQEKGTIAFWQNDLRNAVTSHSNFFIPVRVFIGIQKNINKTS